MKEELQVKDFQIENTGGGIHVAWGSFTNGTYFSIGSEALFIYDEDEYKAMDNDNYDGYTWEQKHLIKEYGNYEGINEEYLNVLNQIWDKCTDSFKYQLDLFESIEKEVK